MEGRDNYRTYNSFRVGSSTIWRSSAIGASSRSLREDDEEALKWAAIEKLPTFERLRKGILRSPHGSNEIDIRNLGFEERRSLIERLVKDPEEDNEKFLLKLKKRIDRVGINLPTIEVRFEHLNIEAEAYEGSRASPSFINFTFDLLELMETWGMVASLNNWVVRDYHRLVKSVTSLPKYRCIVMSRMTLLLGPPSSGKTTLLLALAGKLDKGLQSTGRVTYNGHELNEFVPERTASYISQHDLHIGEMTVRETLAFSARCQGVGDRYDMLAELCRREKAANIRPDTDIDIYMKAAATEGQQINVVTDYILKILGLEICADTIAGDEMRRGISGGQRKRLTVGEMIVGPTKALFMDEISTGLDTSTTYQIVNSLKHCVHILNTTAIISLLQPAPETYNLFDDIILLSDGHIVYQGPCEFVLEFFMSLGFKCPERKSVADFLQEVTSNKDQPQYWARIDEPYRFISAKEFAEAFHSFHVGGKLGDELSIPFDKRKSHPAALSSKKYGAGKKELLKACIEREFLLMTRNSFFYIFKLSQLSVLAALGMSVFLRTELKKNTIADGNIYIGAMFYTVIMVMFNGMSEIPITIAMLPVFYKQRGFLFYPPWAYAFPSWILKIPITLFEVAVWTILTYYVIGYDPCFGRFLKQYLLLILVNQMSSALFRLTGAVCRNMIISSTFGSFIIVACFLLGGVVISREQVKKWWLWGYWSSPLMYAQNAIFVNEFLGHSWSHVINVTNFPEPLGLLILKYRGFFVDASWYWIGIVALAGFTILFNFGFAMALTFLDPFGKSRATNPQEPEIQLSSCKINSVDTRKLGVRYENIMRNVANGKRGMVLPFEKHFVTFDEIVYAVDMPQEMKNQGVVEDRLVILKGVSGAFRPGVLTALMGVSGAGKTTLLDVLAGRKTGGYIEGSITISGYPKKQETFARISGYCEQNDIHSPHVTVHESLAFSAWLRLRPDINKETREMFVEEVMELVELSPLRHVLVGLTGVNGLSTEQRKRLTIAVELVANPSIIFMDEPTSGLDARAAAIVMRIVRNTVDTGRTVVCTIHQPSIDIFEAFDELFLLKKGGQEIYVGPLGHHSSHLIKYFENIHGVSKIKDGYNPATWMLEVTTPAQEMALGVDFNEHYKNSDLYRRNKRLIRELSVPAPGSKVLYFPTQYSQSFFMQCMASLWKQNWSYWRNPEYTAVRFLFTNVIGLMFGSIFWDLGGRTKTQQDLINAMGSMYAAVLFLGVQNASAVQPVVSVERTVFYRERSAGMYSAMPYAFAQVLIEIPYVFTQALTYSLIVYAMIGFEWTVAKFFWYLYFIFFSLMYFTFYGMMTVAVTPNHPTAIIVSTAFYGIWSLFSGFVIPRPSIPVWWRWYYWTCPVAWTLYGMVVSQFGDIQNVLDTGETVEEYLISFFGFRHDFVGVCAGVIFGTTVLYGVIFAVSIKVLNFQKR